MAIPIGTILGTYTFSSHIGSGGMGEVYQAHDSKLGLMGTTAYMSPEQAKGKQVDKRTDIFAFGSVLYELLTGKQAFHGEDVGDILAEVVKSEPDWSRLPADTPLAIRRLLRRCMRKDKQQRIPDAGAVRIEIEDAIAAPKDSDAMQAAPASTNKLPWAVAAAVTIVAIVASFG